MKRVLVADDHEIVRRGIRAVVESRPNWEVVAEAGEGHEALSLAIEKRPDIAIIDYSLPGMNGALLTRRICMELPKAQVLIFTMHESERLIREVLTAGARGFLLKSDADGQLFAALDALAARQPFFSAHVSEALLKRYLADADNEDELGVLTTREREVMQLVAEGNTNKQVAEILAISPKTVDVHRTSVMAKLGLKSTAALVRYAIRNKLIDP